MSGSDARSLQSAAPTTPSSAPGRNSNPIEKPDTTASTTSVTEAKSAAGRAARLPPRRPAIAAPPSTAAPAATSPMKAQVTGSMPSSSRDRVDSVECDSPLELTVVELVAMVGPRIAKSKPAPAARAATPHIQMLADLMQPIMRLAENTARRRSHIARLLLATRSQSSVGSSNPRPAQLHGLWRSAQYIRDGIP